jgi:hypothetical protein
MVAGNATLNSPADSCDVVMAGFRIQFGAPISLIVPVVVNALPRK